jgi:hypothetical protein
MTQSCSNYHHHPEQRAVLIPHLSLFVCLAIGFGVTLIGNAFAQGANSPATPVTRTGVDVNVGTTSSSNGAAIVASNVEKQWADFLKAEGNKNGQGQFTEGSNTLPDGRLLVYQSGKSEVNAAIGSPNFIAARNAAFGKSELEAKKNLAEFVATILKSSRGYDLAQQGAEDAPPMLQQALAPVSIAKKAAILTDKALDEQIRQFEPKWDGTGKTEEDKKAALIKEQTRYSSNIAASARLFTSGSFTVANFEGPDAEQHYSVLTGIIWSLRLADVATSIYSPGSTPHVGATGGPSLKQQLDTMSEENPDLYAVSGGARVWRDENGHFSIIAFGSAAGTSISAIDRDKATINARVFIQQFVGETIETNAESKDAFTMQDTTDGVHTFNGDSYNRNIAANAKDIALSGALTLGQWRGEHPAGKVKMQVVVLAWSPTSAQTAGLLSNALKSQQQNMQSQSRGPANRGSAGSQSGGEIASPVRSGASANTSDF